MARPPDRRPVTSGPPPSRWRVVEQGRRLVVIDTHTGQPATRGDAAPPVETAAVGPERIAFDGRAALVTRRFYDDKGPRRLVLDEGAARWIENARSLAIGGGVLAMVLAILMPSLVAILVIGAIALANPKTRAALRTPITAWLDRYETDAS